MHPELSPFEIDVLSAFYRPGPESWDKIDGPALREQRKAAIERLAFLQLLDEVEPFAFRITHAGHTLLDERWAKEAETP